MRKPQTANGCWVTFFFFFFLVLSLLPGGVFISLLLSFASSSAGVVGGGLQVPGVDPCNAVGSAARPGQHRSGGGAQPSLLVWVSNDMAEFPLAKVLHFPRPERLLPIAPYAQQRAQPDVGRFPSALWSSAHSQHHLPQRVIRARDSEAQPRVAALTKRLGRR